METGNKDKVVGVALYELIGTSFIMYAIMLNSGALTSGTVISFGMSLLAWNVSGGHFNPCLTVAMYVAEKDFGGNLITALIMIVAQFVGAFAGVLWGYLAILAPGQVSKKASVPLDWVGIIAPLTPSGGEDLGGSIDGFTRNWQCFWGILMATIILSLGYVTIKHKATRFSEDSVLNSALFYLVI